MPFTVTMPKLSPTMSEGVIVKWHKKPDEHVEAGDLLIEVATDKATVEYQALDSGWLRKMLIPEGGNALVNQAIAIFTEQENESIEGYQPTGITPPVQTSKKGEFVSASKKENETAPALRETSASLQEPLFLPEPPLKEKECSEEDSSSRIFASPLARKLAKERHLDLATVRGSGPGHRIVSHDLEKAHPLGDFSFTRHSGVRASAETFEEETLTPMRKTIGQRLQQAKTFIPHFYIQQMIDAEPIAAFREQLHQLGIKVTFNDCIVRASALALRKHPEVNSGFHSGNQTLIRFKTVDIAVAVTLAGGLVTPIIRHADHKDLGKISTEMRSLAKRAKEGKLEPQEYKGGSFTISNLGMYGISDFQAIINPPQAAILAVSAIQEVPVVKKGSVVPGKTMSLTLSADHRVIDGAIGAEFMRTLKHYLENPVSILLVKT